MANIPKITSDALLDLINNQEQGGSDPGGGDGGTGGPVTIPEATVNAAGLMSASDKAKLNGIQNNAVSINHVHSNATVTLAGFMSAPDKSKLDGLNPYSKDEVDNLIAQSGSNQEWKEAIATYSLLASTYPDPEAGWTVTTLDTGNKYQFDGVTWILIDSGTAPLVTQTSNGTMSAADKVKLDGIAPNANNYTHPSSHPASIIVEDATHRWTTDAEKAKWNSGGVPFVITPEAYGALPNGSFDCTSAFTSAITAIETNGGGELRLSAGTYLVSGIRIVAQLAIRGTGFGTVIKLKNGSNSHVIQPKDDSISNFTLENFSIDGNKANNSVGSGIYLKKSAATKAAYVYHTTADQDLNGTIRDVLVFNCSDHGIFADAPVLATLNVRNLHIDNVWLEHNGKAGFYGKNVLDLKVANSVSTGNGYAGYSMSACLNAQFSKCTALSNVQNGASTDLGEYHLDSCERVTMIGTEAREGVRHGFYVNASSVVNITACIADSNGQGVTSYYGYYFAGGCTHLDVASSATSSRTPSWQWRAFYLENGSNNRINMTTKNLLDTTTPYLLSPTNLNVRIMLNGVMDYPKTSGGGAPTLSALYVGQNYVDIANLKVYHAVKTGTGSGDWALLSGGTGGGGTALVNFVVTPEQYGAVPNGSFDCTAAFDLATAAIEAMGGGTLQLSPGVYVTKWLKLVCQMNVQGAGWNSVLKLKSATNGHLIQPKDDTLVNFTLQDFAIDGNRTGNSTGSGIYLKKPSSTRAAFLNHSPNGNDMNGYISNLQVYECADHGMFIDVGSPTTMNVRGLHVYQCHFQHNDKNGIYAVNATDSKFTNVVVMGSGDAGIKLAGGANNHFIGVKCFYNNDTTGADMGEFHLDSIGRSAFTTCEAQEGKKHGFYFYQSSLIHMESCIADSNGQGSTGFYGYYMDGNTYMGVKNCSATSFHGSGGSSWQYRALYNTGGNNNVYELLVKNQMDSTVYLVNGTPPTTRVTINDAQQYPTSGGSSGGGGGTSPSGTLATIYSDQFTRSNGTLAVAPYTITAGTWNVTSNQAVLTTTGGAIDRALVDATTGDMTVQVKFVSASAWQRLVFRHSDTGNEWQFGSINGNTTYRLYKRVANSNTLVATATGVTLAANDVVKVACSGSTITCYVNDVQVAQVTDTFNQTATKCGMSGENASGLIFDDLTVSMMLSSTGIQIVDSLPAANAALRGVTFILNGGSGLPDTLYACIKLGDGTYDWVSVR